MTTSYTIPGYVKDYIKDQGYPFCYGDMAPYIETWYQFLKAEGDFWDWEERVNGVHRKVHRMSIHPAARVCNEWASLLLNEETEVATGDEACNEWLESFLRSVNFNVRGQGSIMRAFALGTGAWDLWVDTERGKLQVPTYDARMVLPLSWDDSGVTEVGLCTQVSYKGELLDQLKMHVIGDGGNYRILSKFWDREGNEVVPEGVIEDFDTGGDIPWFAIVKPGVENTRVDLSPYGQSVYADGIDAMKGVDMCYDAIFNEVDLAKMRIFLSDMLIEYEASDAQGNQRTYKNAIPFGRDNTIFRKVSSVSASDMITPFAPAMRTESQVRAYRMAIQAMGDVCGFGLKYFDIDDSGGIKTATEVSSDNSALMRNIRKHENLLEASIAQLCHAALHAARTFLGEGLPDEGEVTVSFDDSIITDTAAEKKQDLAELNLTLNPWEYREKWYGESEDEARANVPGAAVPEDIEPLG